MRLRLLKETDLEAIRVLRNQNRSSFFDDAEISPEQQWQWFSSLLGKPVLFYVLEVDGKVVGTISVTDRGSRREIGNLLLNEDYRGQGLMQAALQEVTAEPAHYFSEVKVGNEASLNVFRRAGFSEEYVVLERRDTPRPERNVRDLS